MIQILKRSLQNMKRIVTGLIVLISLINGAAKAQLAGGNLFLQGRYLETGCQPNGSFGSGMAALSGYHTRGTASGCGFFGANLAFTCDFTLDGWTTGTPAYMGDYTLPGSPWEGWAVEVNGQNGYAYETTCSFTGSGTLSGSFASYSGITRALSSTWSSRGFRAAGIWNGTFVSSSGTLAITKEYRIDTEASAVVVTAKFTNQGTSTMNNVFYLRSCDPDNSVAWGGSFSTINTIDYQNDAAHRVMVTATATGSASSSGSPAAPMSLGTKDCRAKCLIYTSWPMSTSSRLFDVYYGVSSTIGTSYYSAQGSVTNDIAIALVYNIGSIRAGDSAIISYAYIFNHFRGMNGVDSAFPTPKMRIGGIYYDSIASFVDCADTLLPDPLPVEIIYGNDKGFSWSNWTWAPATGLSGTTGLVNSISRGALSSSIIYTITGTSSAMGSCLSKQFFVRVVPAAVRPVVSNMTFCQFDTPIPISVTGTNLRWYTSATGGVGGTITPTVDTRTAGVFRWWVSQVKDTCESQRVPLVITVNPKPAPPTVLRQTYCQYDLPSPVSATGVGLIWYHGTAAGTTTAPTPSTATPGIDTYYVTQTILGCTSDRAIDPVTVIEKPVAPYTIDTTYCQYDYAPTLTAIGANLKWYTIPVGGSALSAAPTPSTTSVGSTTWYVSQTVNGCESDRAPITVTILPLPDFTISQGKPYVCQGDTITLSYSGGILTGATYLWSLPVGTTYVVGDSSTPTIIVRFDSLLFQDVRLLTASFGGRCKTEDTINIKVVPHPVSDAYTKQDICLGDTITIALRYRSGNAHRFEWDFDGATVITASSNSGGPYKIRFNDSGAHIISLKSYTTEGCESKTTYDTVKVHALPSAKISNIASGDVVCFEDSVLLRAAIELAAVRYEWNPVHYFDMPSGSRTWARIENRGFVRLRATDAFGCTAIDSVYITPESCCELEFPTAFTPNGDGKNDQFRPVFKNGGYHRFSVFRVTNRWGQTVFETTNNRNGWDGTFNGEPQDLGVYFYFIKYECDDNNNSIQAEAKSKIKKGEVLLMR